jgi:predicted TIM-barrel enzyme
MTGRVTGEPPQAADLEAARAGAAGCPLLIGSGLDAQNAPRLLALADGAIVGTSLKTGDAVDRAKVEALVAAARALDSSG